MTRGSKRVLSALLILAFIVYQAAGAVLPVARAAGPTLTVRDAIVPEDVGTDVGHISHTQVLNLAGGTFAAGITTGDVTANSLPAGLSIVVTRVNDTQLAIDYGGNAASHTNADDVANASFTVAQTAIVGSTGPVTSDVYVIDFDPVYLQVAPLAVHEAAANDGSIAESLTVTLVNGTFAADMSAGVTVQRLPAGLGLAVVRGSDTQLTVSFTGKAANHQNANDVYDAAVQVDQAKVTNARQPVVSGTFMIDFNDGVSASAPTVVSAATSIDGSKVLLTFTKAMADPSGKQAEFAVTAGGSVDIVTAASLGADPKVIELTLATPVAYGQAVTVSYTAGTVTAADTGVLASFGPWTVTNNVPAPPTLSFASTTIDGTKVLMQFTKAMADPTGKHAQFAVTVAGANDPVTAAALKAGDATVIELTLATPAQAAQAVKVAYTAGTVTSADGGILAGFGLTYVQNDTVAPKPVPLSAATTADGTQVRITFDKSMINPVGNQSWFTVTVDGSPATITEAGLVLENGNIVTLTLATPVQYGQAVTVAYTPGALHSIEGGYADAFGPMAVTSTVPAPLTPTLTVGSAVISEAAANDGSLAGAQVVTLVNGTFAVDIATADVTVNMLPAGLGIVVTRVSDTQIQIGFTGAALNHADANDVAGVSVTVAQAKITGATSDMTSDTFTIDFRDPDPVVDTTPPALQTAAVNAAALTLTYSEALDAASMPATGDFDVRVNGVARGVNAVGISGTTVALTLAGPVVAGETVTVSYTPGANPVRDAAGNTAAALTAQSVTNATADTTPPSFVNTDPADGGVQVPTDKVIRVNFSEAIQVGQMSAWDAITVVDHVGNNHFASPGTDGNALTLNPAMGVNITYTVTIPANAVKDAGGNYYASAISFSFSTTDTVAPTQSSADPANWATGVATNKTISVVFSENIQPGAQYGSISLAETNPPNTVVAVTCGVSGQTLTVAPQGGLAADTWYTLTVPAGAVSDPYGNTLAVAVVINFQTQAGPDTTPPQLSAATVDGATLTLTYDEALDGGSQPASTDFVVTVQGTPRTVTGVNVAGNAVTLTLATPVVNTDAVAVSYTPGASPVRDLAGNGAAALTDQAVANNTAGSGDTTPPALQSAAVDGATLTLTYNEALYADVAPAADSFTVLVNGNPRTVSVVAIGGSSAVLTLVSPVNALETVVLTYIAPAMNPLQDLHGNGAANLTGQAVVNNTTGSGDTTPPSLSVAAVDGATLTLTYDETLDGGSAPAATAFTVLVDGTPRGVANVAIVGPVVTLALASPVVAGETVVISYSAPGVNPLQDAAGNGAAALNGQAVANNTAPDVTPPAATLVSAGDGLVITMAERDGADPAARSVVARSSKAGALYLVNTSISLSGDDAAKVAAMNAAIAASAAVKVDAQAGTDAYLLVGSDLLPGTYKVYAVDGIGKVSPGSADITVEPRSQNPVIAYSDADTDHVYFNGDSFGVNVTGLNLPDGTALRVALGILTGPGLPDTTLPPLSGVGDAGSYHYANVTVTGGGFNLSGAVDNPGNSTLPAGLLALKLYSSDGSQAYTGSYLPIQDAADHGALVGLTIPSGDVTSSPGLETFINLYSTEKSITFTRAGLGSITFGPGLDFIGGRSQLESLQAGVDIGFKGGQLNAGVATDILTFLADKGATIEFSEAMAKLGLTGVTPGNFRDFIVIGAMDNTGAAVSAADLPGYLDLGALSYDGATDALAIPVHHFTSYDVGKDTTAPTWSGASLTAGGLSPTGLTLTWTGASDITRVTGYRVYRNGDLISTLGAVSSMNVTGLTAGTTYTFKVEAGDPSGNWSTAGPSATVTTLSEQSGGGSGGGSGGSGGTAGTPPVTAQPAPEPVIEGDQADVTKSAEVEKTTEDDGTSVATVTVKTGTVEKALATEGVKDIVLEIKETADTKTAALSAEAFTKMAQHEANMVVKTDLANLIIPGQAIKTEDLAQTLGADPKDIRIEIKVSQAPADKVQALTTAARSDPGLKPVGTVLQFNLVATAGGKAVNVTSFQTAVSGEFPISTEAATKVQNLEDLNVYKFNEATQGWVYVPSKVDPSGTKVIFSTTTFSHYALMEYRKTFADVQDHWARPDIELMAGKYVVKGVAADRFAPAKSLTRAEFATMLVRAMGLAEDPASQARFSDIATGTWYYGYVQTAARAGLVNGRGDGTFGPNDLVTREQAAAMLMRALRASDKGGSLAADQARALLSAYDDRDTVSVWAEGDLAGSIEQGILCGQTGQVPTALAAQAVATRAEAAVMMARFWRK